MLIIILPEKDCKTGYVTYFGVFIALFHAVITLILSYYLTCIFYDDLIRLKSSICPNAVASIDSFHDLNSNPVFAPGLAPLSQIRKSTICAMIGPNLAVVIVTFIQHETVVAIFAATGLWRTLARRILLGFGFLPYISCIANKNIYNQGVSILLWKRGLGILLCVFFHSSGFGCPGGRGEKTSKGSLKSLPISRVLLPANIGSGIARVQLD